MSLAAEAEEQIIPVRHKPMHIKSANLFILILLPFVNKG
jgi:hypothetical protein